jgi:GTPase SAR1 family protein
MSNMSKKEVNTKLKNLDVNMKIWDIGGQFQYRQNWIEYAKNADVVIFMVDSSNVKNDLLTHSMTLSQ